ncbi:MAG: LON peptidase substrate-binding domain-containing protein [Vicinamibacterales bacterium]
MLPTDIPIFPLPNVVLFPNVFLPLHIFEPRYRAMVADALNGDRIIGMVLLQPGWQADYLGRPPVYSVGCAGLVTHADALDDGRYNIILRGLEKFRIVGEVDPVPARLYRRARIDGLDEPVTAAVREEIKQGRSRLEALLTDSPRIGGTTLSDEDLVNALAQYLDLEPVEKQALLERDGLPSRCQSLIDLLEMKLITARHKTALSRAH